MTGYRKNASTVDGYWGDIIVADFNFDGREDFAVRKWESPMDSPIEPCDFYIQNEKGKFLKDKYLSSQMKVFPDKIDSRKHILSLRICVGARPEVHEEKYKYNSKTHRWAKIK